MNKTETAKLLALFKAAYSTYRPTETESEVTVNFWHRLLGDVDWPEAERAFFRLMATRTSGFMPQIGEVRRAVMQARHPSLLVLPEDAWGEAWSNVKAVGRNRTPEWSHPALAAAVEVIGWADICNTNTDNLGTLRAQFMKVYRAKQEAAEVEAATPASLRLAIPRPENGRLVLSHVAPVAALASPQALLEGEEGYTEGEAWQEGLERVKAALRGANPPKPAAQVENTPAPRLTFKEEDIQDTTPAQEAVGE